MPEAKYLLTSLDDLITVFIVYHGVPITQQCWYVEKGDCVYQARLSGEFIKSKQAADSGSSSDDRVAQVKYTRPLVVWF